MEISHKNREGRLYAPESKPTTEKPSSVCTRTTLNYDCIIENIRLTHDESKTFGLNWKNNPQKNVTFIDSRLAILPKSLFEAFPQMELLNAGDLQIEEIDNQAFGNAYNLKMLYLQRNYISSIKTFQHVPLLIHLDLSNNEITHINQNAFERNTQLKSLIMSLNRVGELPTFKKNLNLEVLYLSNNELQTISNNKFRNNYMLKDLDISHNQLSQFNLLQLNDKSKLTTVDVSYNNLASLYIPQHVQKLDARNNSINDITANVCKLKRLYLSNNQISDVSSLHKCTDLLFLDLSHNQLKSFDLIVSLPKLNDLNLAHNKLFEIDIYTRYPHPLQFLDVSYNFLIYVPANKLSKLKTVKLNNNKFIEFKFSNLKEINFITLSRNEWDCDAIVQIMQQKGDSIDDNQETCTRWMITISKSGICCRNYTRAFYDRLSEILRETNLHENLNKKDRKAYFTQTNPTNTMIKPNLNEIIDLDSETKNILRQLNDGKKKNEGVTLEIESEKIKRSRLQQADKQYQYMIEKLRGYYGIAKEGLINSNLTLNRVVQYTQERNSLSIDLLERKNREKNETDVRLNNKNLEKSTLMKEIDNLNALLDVLKEKENMLKSEWSLFKKEILQVKDDLFCAVSDPCSNSDQRICCKDDMHALNDRLREILLEIHRREKSNKHDTEHCYQIKPIYENIRKSHAKTGILISITKQISHQTETVKSEIEIFNWRIEYEKIQQSEKFAEIEQIKEAIKELVDQYRVFQGFDGYFRALNKIEKLTQKRNNYSYDLLLRRKLENMFTVSRLKKLQLQKMTKQT